MTWPTTEELQEAVEEGKKRQAARIASMSEEDRKDYYAIKASSERRLERETRRKCVNCWQWVLPAQSSKWQCNKGRDVKGTTVACESFECGEKVLRRTGKANLCDCVKDCDACNIETTKGSK